MEKQTILRGNVRNPTSTKKGKKKDDKQETESFVGYSKTEREEGDSDQESSDSNIFFASVEEWSKWPIIDSEASKSLTNKKDAIKWTKSLSRDIKNMIFAGIKIERKATFKIGWEQTMRANKTIIMPMKWKQETFKLKLHVIPHPVPFLIGIEAMKKMGIMLDLKNDKMSIWAQTE